MKKILAAFALVLLSAPAALAANCAAFTYTLTNGTTADANQVMSNFNNLLTCANNNLAHNGANSDITSLSGITTPLTVPEGGTDLGTLTAHAVPIGEGTSAPNFATIGTSGFVLMDNGSGLDPSFKYPVLTENVTSTGSNVPLNATPAVVVQKNVGASGIWFAAANAVFMDTSGASEFDCTLTDGTTIVSSGSVESTASNTPVHMTLDGVLVNPAGNIQMKCTATGAASSALFDKSGASHDLTLTTIRIG